MVICVNKSIDNNLAQEVDIKAGLENKLNKQRAAHVANPYPSASEREDRIDRLIDMTLSHQQKFTEAVNADFGRRSAINTKMFDLGPVVNAGKHAKKHLRGWMKTEKRKSTFPLGLLGAKSTIEYLPLGVVGNISPWNFPVQLSLQPIVDIFSAGNRCMLKPSELTPQTSELMAELVAGNFDESEFSVTTGGPEVAGAFSALAYDHLLFTGSTNIAKLVAQSAAPNLVPLTLELGGKNPTVVSPSAKLDEAAEKVMWAKTMNGGQICLCPDMVYVHESVIDEFVESCKQQMKKLYKDFENDDDFINIISPRHAQRLEDLLQDAEQKGAELIRFGETKGQCVPPTLVLNTSSDARLMQEEIFGGPTPIMPYSDCREIANSVNAGEKPLALYYFGSDANEIEYLSRNVLSGGMTINDCIGHVSQEDLPFGGVGASGMGVYHGFDGFKNFSHAKSIYKQSPVDPLKMIRPPYTDKMKKLVESILKK